MLVSSREAVSASVAPQARLASLDAFRGLAVLGMLVVNNKAFGPWTPSQLIHGDWADVHLADLIFPWFVLIVGVALPLAEASARRRGFAGIRRLGKVLLRAGWLVAIGILINSSYAHHPLFDLGILQLIGVSYLLTALLYRLPLRARVAAAAILLVGHWAALRFTPLPGLPAGTFTETRNFVDRLEDLYLQRLHLEHLTSVVTLTALMLVGTFAGDYLQRAPEARSRQARGLLLAGAAGVLAGWLWGLEQPMVKRLVTASFTLFSAGTGLMALAGCYWLVDVLRRRTWSFPLVVLGRNALAAFALPILVNIYVLGGWTWPGRDGSAAPLGRALLEGFVRHAGVGLGGVLFTFSLVTAWWLVCYGLYRHRVFVRV